MGTDIYGADYYRMHNYPWRIGFNKASLEVLEWKETISFVCACY